MMGWLGRSTSTPAGFIDRKKVEAGAAFSSLENHWKQAKAVMDNDNAQSAADALTVISHVSQMVSFLRLTKNDDSEHNCKTFWIHNHCSDRVIQWLHSLQVKGIQLEYEDEKKLVQTLESFCELASSDGEFLLGFECNSHPMSNNVLGEEVSSWDSTCSLSSLLLEYSLRDDPCLGEPARSSFIILIELASKYPEFEKCFSNSTGLELTSVVISGLSACFAQLPTFYSGTNEQIEPFITQLKFIDSVAYAAPPTISLTIADCFSNAFLHAVILPALTQDDGNRSLHSQDDHFVTSLHEEIAIVTGYLKIVCENLTHPLLIKSLMEFTLNNLLNDLLKRMNHQNFSVTVSTLGLISVLLTFYCEDFWYELILRHLMVQSHLMVSQRNIRLPEINYQDASLRFLSLIPTQVLEVMGSDVIRFQYSQYLENELHRLPMFFSQEFPVSINSTNTSSRNPVFPMWKYKYDGTDEIPFSLKSLKSPNLQDTSQDSRNMSTTGKKHFVENIAMNADQLTITQLTGTQASQEPFITISLQATTTDEQFNSLGATSTANSEDLSNPSLTNDVAPQSSDGYGSMEMDTLTLSDNSASFCPFLDILLVHLKNLNKLPPDMILMVTEIISTLAGSRIPLVTSILLDSDQIILQPSYVSFPMLLNRIRVEFDQSLKPHLNSLSEVWNAFSKDLAATQQNDTSNLSLSSSMSMNFMHSLSNSFETSFGDGSFTESIKKKITNNSSIGPFFNNVFQRKSSSGSVAKNSLPGRSGNGEVNESQLLDTSSSPSATNHQIYRLKTGQIAPPNTSSPQSNKSTESIRLMATRALYFSHWLLEMASIAHQLCWKRPSA